MITESEWKIRKRTFWLYSIFVFVMIHIWWAIGMMNFGIFCLWIMIWNILTMYSRFGNYINEIDLVMEAKC